MVLSTSIANRPSLTPSIVPKKRKSVQQAGLVERRLREAFPDEIRAVVSKTGRAGIATDPMGVNVSDVLVIVHPKKQWKRARP
jgi:cobalt-zinc-cadmium resistance protein CzcA